jgi:hypothetical protein
MDRDQSLLMERPGLCSLCRFSIEYLPDFAQGFARRLETALQQL